MLHVAMVTHAFHFQEQNGDHIVGLHMRLALEELFYVYKVNIHLAGHLHSYERTCPVIAGDCVSPGSGTVYVIVGSAGKFLDAESYTEYPWSKYQNCEKFGYERITANTTHMLVEFVTAPGGQVLDNFIVPSWEENLAHRDFKKWN